MVRPRVRATPPLCSTACMSGLITIFHLCASLLEWSFLWRHPRSDWHIGLHLEQFLKAERAVCGVCLGLVSVSATFLLKQLDSIPQKGFGPVEQ